MIVQYGEISLDVMWKPAGNKGKHTEGQCMETLGSAWECDWVVGSQILTIVSRWSFGLKAKPREADQRPALMTLTTM